MRNSSIRRQRMIRELRDRGISRPDVLQAMANVPRESFVEEALRDEAYRDAALPIGEKQVISQPYIVARMNELLDPDGKGKVLEIGSGSGYHAAVLASLFEIVYSVERIPSLSRRARERVRDLGIENVHFKVFDGSYGWSEFAPYRAIVVTAAAPEVPAPLLEQLEPGGRLVIPVSKDAIENDDDAQTLVRVIRNGDEYVREEHGPCRFVPLVGKFGWAG